MGIEYLEERRKTTKGEENRPVIINGNQFKDLIK